jgi:magnesium-transporting ATPase (P-type)
MAGPGGGVGLEVGLTSEAAARRLEIDGPNRLPPPPRRPVLLALGAQMTHFFALMLWVASVLAWIGGMAQLAVAIVAVVVINGVFAFVQEHRAERAADKLQDLLPRRVTVRRDGTLVEIDAAGLVVDDVVVLAAGDQISADLRLLEAHQLAVDTSLLTGESVPERPGVGDGLYAGTFVTEGEGTALVVATGVRTRLGGIAELTQAGRRPDSPLALELRRVVKVVAAVAVSVGIAFFGIGVALGMEAVDGFLFAVGVTVALVPEGLLPTVTLALAVGAQQMARSQALVRRLESVETLGSTTFICTDKTGTLTRNQMTVVEVWTPVGSATVEGEGYAPEGRVVPDGAGADEVAGAGPVVGAVAELARAAGRASTGRAIVSDGTWIARGDPMEAALDVLARRCGVDLAADEARSPEARRLPFDPVRRRMSLVVGGELLLKGAADSVLPRCVLGPEVAAAAAGAVEGFGARGLRVLAVARRSDPPEGTDPDQVEAELELLGLVALEDPPRPAARDALASCRSAGIKVAMVTGDHPATALAIAREVGLALEGAPVVEGAQLPEDDEELGELLDQDGIVLARVAPEDKLRIARALRARDHVVAMTGDGVNDGPALREADIGVAMGAGGTDVAREAADLVLLDDDFSTIVAAVTHGRATFANVRRFLTYHLTDNVAELAPFVAWALTAGHYPLALGVLQILSLDVGTDLLPALALGTEPPAADVLDRPLRNLHLVDRRLLFRVFAVLGPTEAVVELVAFTTVLLAGGWAWGHDPSTALLATASGAAFTAVVLGQMANGLACRSASTPVWRLERRNRFLVWAVLVELGALAGFLWIGPIARVLDQAPPSLVGASVALVAPLAVLAADGLHKAIRGRRRARTGRVPSAVG